MSEGQSQVVGGGRPPAGVPTGPSLAGNIPYTIDQATDLSVILSPSQPNKIIKKFGLIIIKTITYNYFQRCSFFLKFQKFFYTVPAAGRAGERRLASTTILYNNFIKGKYNRKNLPRQTHSVFITLIFATTTTFTKCRQDSNRPRSAQPQIWGLNENLLVWYSKCWARDI